MKAHRIIVRGEEMHLTDYPHLSPNSGNLTYERTLLSDPDSGMMVKQIRYPKGNVTPPHQHHCAHGLYVLSGTLYTDCGELGPGSFVWFPEGEQMEHGGRDEDVDCLLITNKAFDIRYIPR